MLLVFDQCHRVWVDKVSGKSSVDKRLAVASTSVGESDPSRERTVSLPRVEESFRSLAKFHGLPILDTYSDRLHKKSIRKNIENLTRLGDELFFRYLDFLLADHDSINLRNRAMHGIMGQTTQSEAALSIHVACALRSRPLSTLNREDSS